MVMSSQDRACVDVGVDVGVSISNFIFSCCASIICLNACALVSFDVWKYMSST